MHGLMQDWPLRVSRILDHAARFHPRRRVAGRSVEGPLVETDYASVRARALRVAQRVAAMGLGRGDVVGVMAWNTPRMLEVWYGVPGSGAVLHTLNPRLAPEHLVYVINHAADRVLMVDPDLAPIVAAIRDRLTRVREIIVMTDAAHMPDALPDAVAFEDWLADADGDFDWVTGDERDACGICYTSGTTGDPKGVVYTHRSNVLHALAMQGPDIFGLSSSDVLMPVVPLFHANGWSTAYSGPLAGAALMLPGRDLTPAALYELLEMGVTITCAVPTVWLGLLAYLDGEGLTLATLKRVAIGGSSCPRAVIERFQTTYGVRVLHAWGMTETSPIGTVCSFKPEVTALPEAQRLDVQETVGHPPFTVDLRIVDPSGAELPWDGTAEGELMVRGDAVVRRYLRAGTDAAGADGWFGTGDVARMDANGYVRIIDRTKDVIKSGGEWISSIELENAAVGHPDVAEAAAVARADATWGERPVLFVVLHPDRVADADGIRALLAGRFPAWQLPDDIVFVDALPHTATGKVSKRTLRRQMAARAADAAE